MVTEMLQKEFLCDTKIHFHSIKVNFCDIKIYFYSIKTNLYSKKKNLFITFCSSD